MSARLTFLAIAAFWVTMNVLLWREEFAARAGATPVPFDLVWKKILTAPEASSLDIYQGGKHAGYCEFSTSIGQQMAELDDEKLPSENLAARAGYQVNLTGNFAPSGLTNHIKFNGRLRFDNLRQWRELDLKITAHQTTVEIQSLAAQRTLHLKITDDGAVVERVLTFAELQNPNTIIRTVLGDTGKIFPGGFELPELAPAGAPKIQWTACRTRIRIGAETVPVYRLETVALGYTVSADISTIGEILRVALPGNLSARINGLNQP